MFWFLLVLSFCGKYETLYFKYIGNHEQIFAPWYDLPNIMQTIVLSGLAKWDPISEKGMAPDIIIYADFSSICNFRIVASTCLVDKKESYRFCTLSG